MEKVLNIWKNFEDKLISKNKHFNLLIILIKTLAKYFIVIILYFLFIYFNSVVLNNFCWFISIFNNELLKAFFEFYLNYYIFIFTAPIIYLIIFSKFKFSINLYILSLLSIFILQNQIRIYETNPIPILVLKSLYLSLIVVTIISFLLLFIFALSNFINLIRSKDLRGLCLVKNKKVALIINTIILILIISSHFQLNYLGEIRYKPNSFDYRTYLYKFCTEDYYDYNKARYLLLNSLMLNPICIDTWYFLFGNEIRYGIESLGQTQWKIHYVE